MISLVVRIRGAPAVHGGEVSWGFDQLLAMLMLGLPALNSVEISFGRFWQQTSRPKADSCSPRAKSRNAGITRLPSKFGNGTQRR